MAQPIKSQNLIVIDACLIDGEHTEVDTVLRGVPVGDARDLLSSGRVRLATGDEDMAAAEQRASEKAAAIAAPSRGRSLAASA